MRELSPAWSPDGKQIAFYSDATGEYELYLLENREDAVPRQVTRGSAAWKYAAEWSPRSTHLVYSDRTMKLWLVDVSTDRQTAIDEATAEEIRDYSFSPDGDWIAYSKTSPNYQSALWLYQISTGKNNRSPTPLSLTATQHSAAMASISFPIQPRLQPHFQQLRVRLSLQ